jgi:hypothetical protein
MFSGLQVHINFVTTQVARLIVQVIRLKPVFWFVYIAESSNDFLLLFEKRLIFIHLKP